MQLLRIEFSWLCFFFLFLFGYNIVWLCKSVVIKFLMWLFFPSMQYIMGNHVMHESCKRAWPFFFLVIFIYLSCFSKIKLQNVCWRCLLTMSRIEKLKGYETSAAQSWTHISITRRALKTTYVWTKLQT